MQYQNLLFDLDGTLTDPGLGITNSVAYALNKFGITVSDRSALFSFIGPPLIESFMRFYSFSREDAERAVVYYREYFSEIGIFENTPYEGIHSTLEQLRSSGKRLFVATSKPEVYARRITDHFSLTPYFEYIAGASFDETRSEKWDVIRYALATCELRDKSRTVMIGDRKHDMIGAKKTGLDAIGVLWGFGDRAELEETGADIILESVADLKLLEK